MHCKSCGSELPSEYDTHCPNCGQPVGRVPRGRRDKVASDERTCCRVMLLVSAVGLFWAVTMAFMPFFTIKGAVISDFMPKLDLDFSLVEAELMIDLNVILAICLMGAVVIFFEKNSSGIRQIVVGVLLMAAGAIVYYCDKGKVSEINDAIMKGGGSISPGYGLYYYMCGAGLLIASGVALMVIHYIYKIKRRHETVYSDTI